jgi:outer membrane lipoprotein carrier protein
MKIKTTILYLLAISVILAQNPNEVIKKLQTRFNSINNFTAEFQQTFFSTSNVENRKVSGNFFYKKKNKFVVELKNRSIISDGFNVWNYDKKFNRVIISYAQDDPTSFSLEKFIFDYPLLCKTRLVKNDLQNNNEKVIELTPKDDDLQFKIVRIWKGEDNLISRMEMTDLGDIKYSFSFTDVKINQDIPDSKFNFTPAKGTKVIDLR